MDIVIPALPVVLEEQGLSENQTLLAALYEREDSIATALHLLGAQFGLYPEIVAEVITNAVMLGTPVPEEQRTHVRQQFVARMEWIRQQQNNNPDNG